MWVILPALGSIKYILFPAKVELVVKVKTFAAPETEIQEGFAPAPFVDKTSPEEPAPNLVIFVPSKYKTSPCAKELTPLKLTAPSALKTWLKSKPFKPELTSKL